MEYPDPALCSEEDLEDYSEIVLKTSTYRAGNKLQARRLKTSEGYKYTNIILPILYKQGIKQPPQSIKKGVGFQKIVTDSFPEYVYYNSREELLERLYIHFVQ